MMNYAMGVRRGEVHWVRNNHAYGSEMRKDRPAIVVSNNMGNEHSPVIEVVYMTTQPKKDLPTHVFIKSTSNGRCEGSTALCEQIHTIGKERLKENSYVCRLTDDEMDKIDEALMISLGLDDYLPGDDEQPERHEEHCEAPDEVEEYEEYEEYDDSELAETMDKLRHAEMERDFYKQQYDMLLDKIMNR